MAEDRLDIDKQTIEDNDDQQQIEFEAEVGDERYQFAVRYDVLEALSGESPEDGAALPLFKQYADEIGDAGLAALARDPDADMIVITDSDIE